MPDPFLSICPHCQAKLKLKDPALIGKVAKCPACKEKFTVEKAAPAARSRPKTATTASRPAAPATPKAKPRPQPRPEPDDELDPWLNDDLGDFDAEDTAVAEGRTAVPAPPPVRGVTKKRKSSAGSAAKKRKQRSVGAEHISWIGWVVGGGIAGAIGAGAWGAISAFTFTEWGILAWAIGGFVGFGVRIGAREEDVGLAPGLTALGIAMVAVIAGKFLAVHFMLASLEKMFEGAAAAANGAQVEQVETTDDEAIEMILVDFADEVEFEWGEQGREWNEPDYDNIPDDAPVEAWYDPVIWAEAKQKWEALSPEEQAKMIVEYKTGEFGFGGDLGELKAAIFAESFGLLDILFFLLAAGTAFKVGSGLDFGDE